MEILQAVGESHDLLARFFPLMLTLAWNVGRGLLRENLVFLVIFINCVCLFGSPREIEKKKTFSVTIHLKFIEQIYPARVCSSSLGLSF